MSWNPSQEVSLPAEDTVLGALGILTTPTSLTLPPDISYENYELVGAFIGRIHDASNWWLGCWLNQGEMLFGDKIYQAAEATHRSPQTLRNVASVVNRVPDTRRHKELSFSAHAEVAALEPPDQERWLQTCESERLTTMELRARIRAERNGTPDITEADPVCKCCGRPLAG